MSTTRTFHLFVSLSGAMFGEVVISKHRLDSFFPGEYRYLATRRIEIPAFDLAQLEADQLDHQVLRIHKELDAQMTQIQSRKQELLAIGHEVTE